MRYILPLLALSLSAVPALASATTTGVTVGVTGGTLGVGPEISYKVNPLLSVRASAAFLGVSGHGHVSDYQYDGKLRLQNFGGTVDLHPFKGDFRLSAGARITSGNRVHIHGSPIGPQTYGGVTYSEDEAGSLSGDIKTASVSPIVTIGYSHTTHSGLMFGLDGGVMYQGHPRVENIATTGQLNSNPAAQDQVNHQIQRLRDNVRDYPYYPVVQLSLGYRF